MNEKLLTLKQAAEILGVKKGTVYKWCDEGRIPFIDLSLLYKDSKQRVLRFKRSQLEILIEQCSRGLKI